MAHEDQELPPFIAPMLAKTGAPFDSDQHLFEIKWDGTRTLAFLDRAAYRLLNRRQADMTGRYPEFAFLGQLPRGIVLDGEFVVLSQGKPDFGLLQSRDHARSDLKIRNLAKSLPATYIVFDLLYLNFREQMSLPLQARREKLAGLLKAWGQPRLVLSEGIVGQGKAYFHEVCKQGLEGIVAKRLNSRYLPGQRTDAWIKIKKGETVTCAIIGFVPAAGDEEDFRSLILAADVAGELRHVGQVGTGFNLAMRQKINGLLRARLRSKPVIPCTIKGKWIEPVLFCRVHCMETTGRGHLRAPTFQGLLEEP